MFRIIIFLITSLSECFMFTNKLNIYATIGEKFALPLPAIFQESNYNYTCTGCSENITLWNQFNQLYQNELSYTTQSMSSNGTHFVISTEEQTINVYIYENNEMTIQCLIKIDSNLQCYNSMFTQSENILFDCYDGNSLQFYYLKNCEFNLIQTIQNQNIPIKTKMLNYLKGQQIYLLYAQYYKNYELLTSFLYSENLFINQTTWTQGFYDFDVSKRFIYINFYGELQQVYITETNNLSVLCTCNNEDQSFSSIKVQNLIFFNSNFDMIFMVQYIGLKQYLGTFYYASNGSISQINQITLNIKSNSQVIQILFSNQYMIIQVANNIEVYTMDLINFQYQYTIISNFPLQQYSYLDACQNNLFQFSNLIAIFKLNTPSLEMYFESKKQLNPLMIQGFSSENIKQWKETNFLIIYPFILEQNDTNIVITHESHQQFYFTIEQNINFSYPILGFSGPLMKSTIKMLNQQLGNFYDITFYPLNIQFSYVFQVTSFLIVDEGIFFAGSFDGNIYFYFCLNLTQCNLIFSDIRLENITQIIMINNGECLILAGINQGFNDIKIYYFNACFNSTQIIQFSNTVFYSFPAYTQFLFTYDNIIVLLQSQEIMIQSLTSSDQFTLGNEEIKTLFPNYNPKSIHFKPINIAMNEIDLSSILFINNQNSVIIVVIQSTYEIIPYCILNVEFEIYQINIMVYQLIISYNCETLICFQVWNVLDLRKPDFVKNLPSISMLKGWNIVSDNLFLYVKSQINTMYVFNPLLSQHSSLYYEFNFTGNYFSSIAMKKYYTLLFLENLFFKLQIEMIQKYQPFTNFKEIQYIEQTLFYVYVENKFFSNQSTPNKILSIINPLTEIQLPQSKLINWDIHIPFVQYLNPEKELNQSGQIVSYNLTQNQKKNFCYIKNYIEFQSEDIFSIVQPIGIFMINKTLIMQYSFNNSNYFAIKNDQYWNFQSNGQINYTNCSTPLVYYVPNNTNISQISQICYFTNNWYLTIFQYENQTFSIILNQQITTKQITNVTKLTSIHNNTIFFFQAAAQNQQNQEVLYITNTIWKKSLIQLTCRLGTGFFSYTIFEIKNYPNYYLLINICYEVILYEVGFYNESNLSFKIKSFQKQLFYTPYYFSLGQARLLEIQVLQQQRDSIIFLLNTNKGPCFIFQASYFMRVEKNFYFHMFFSQIIQTIPPYGSYELIQSTQILNGLQFFLYKSDIEKVYAIYDLTSIHKNITNPIIMKGGYNSPLPLPTSLAFNFTSIKEGGQFYELNIQQIINTYSVVGNAFLNCTINKKQDYNVNLWAYNSFNNDTVIITFHINTYEWYIGLIIVLAAVFLISSFLFWYNTRDLKDEKNFLEEVHIELE